MSKHSETVARYWGLPVPGHLKHGLNTWAAKAYGCDCKACLPSGKRRSRKAIPPIERQRKSRQRLRGKPVPEGTKHGTYAYRTYRCRCAVCRRARAVEKQRLDNRWRETARGHWVDDPRLGITVIHWPPRELDEPWLCPACQEFKIIP